MNGWRMIGDAVGVHGNTIVDRGMRQHPWISSGLSPRLRGLGTAAIGDAGLAFVLGELQPETFLSLCHLL